MVHDRVAQRKQMTLPAVCRPSWPLVAGEDLRTGRGQA